MWSDPIADMLTRIRNGIRVRKSSVTVPASKLKKGIAQVLKDEGYVHNFDIVAGTNGQDIIRIDLKYGSRGEDVIHVLDRASTPGRRIYRKADELPTVLNGLGIAIMSTSVGVLSDRKCREQKVGGELICTVY